MFGAILLTNITSHGSQHVSHGRLVRLMCLPPSYFGGRGGHATGVVVVGWVPFEELIPPEDDLEHAPQEGGSWPSRSKKFG